jgi:hypothetical protein
MPSRAPGATGNEAASVLCRCSMVFSGEPQAGELQRLKSRFTMIGVPAKRLPNSIDICGQDRGNAGAAKSGQSE